MSCQSLQTSSLLKERDCDKVYTLAVLGATALLNSATNEAVCLLEGSAVNSDACSIGGSGRGQIYMPWRKG